MTFLEEGQQATVLQLPAAPEMPKEQEKPAVSRAEQLDWADIIS